MIHPLIRCRCGNALPEPGRGESTYSVSGEAVCGFMCFMELIGSRIVHMEAVPVDLPPRYSLTIVHDTGPP
jgi:hypothetical protein